MNPYVLVKLPVLTVEYVGSADETLVASKSSTTGIIAEPILSSVLSSAFVSSDTIVKSEMNCDISATSKLSVLIPASPITLSSAFVGAVIVLSAKSYSIPTGDTNLCENVEAPICPSLSSKKSNVVSAPVYKKFALNVAPPVPLSAYPVIGAKPTVTSSEPTVVGWAAVVFPGAK